MLPPLQTPPTTIASLDDYEPFARERIAPGEWAYISGGAADEVTLRENRTAFDRLKLRGRVLGDFSGGGHTRVTLFGHTYDHPILLAPVAYQKLAHSDGELASVLGATAAGAGMVVSTHASCLIEDIARGAQTPLWFQLYIKPDRGFTRELIQRAEGAGYQALVLTADAPVGGLRNREPRVGFRLPAGAATNVAGMPPIGTKAALAAELCGGFMSIAPTWADIAWLRSITKLPILIKGVMDPEDATRAVAEGVDGLVVSNHGGRTLDTLPATIDVLPSIADAVGGRVPLILDGGIRRGTDVLKAVALGASAVMVGRPYVYGLATAGAVGVAHVVRILRAELEIALALTGCPTLSAVNRSVIWTDVSRR